MIRLPDGASRLDALPLGTILHAAQITHGDLIDAWLFEDGRFVVKVKAGLFRWPWPTQRRGANYGKPWIVKKRKTFVGLVRQMQRSGEFDAIATGPASCR